MAKIVLKRGSTQDLEKEKLQDGLLSFTLDDGRIHLDFQNEKGELERMTFYSGKLTFGSHVFDGTKDVDITVYDGEVNN